MEMTKKTKVFVSVTLVCALSLTMFTGCTFGFRTPDYIAFGWSPITQKGAIWRSTDGTIVLDFHDDEVSGNLTADGYIISGDTKIYIEDVALSFRDDYMVEVAANAPDVKKKSAPTIEDDYDEPVHGNSAKSVKLQHGYEIYEEDTGNVVKTGISGQKLNADGSSPRANVQVNALNRKENRSPYNAYKSRVVMTNMPTRADALEWEQQNTNRLFAEKIQCVITSVRFRMM